MWSRFQHSRECTLILLIPPSRFARQEEFVYEKLDAIDAVLDWRAEFLSAVKPTQRYLNLSVRGEVQRLKEVSAVRAGQALCIINTEYALARFGSDERQEFWRALWADFPYNQSILIYAALDSPALLPFNLERWKAAGRVLPLD